MGIDTNSVVLKRLKALRAANPSDGRIKQCIEVVKKHQKRGDVVLGQDFNSLPLTCQLNIEYNGLYNFWIRCTDPNNDVEITGPFDSLEELFAFVESEGVVVYTDIMRAIGIYGTISVTELQRVIRAQRKRTP